MTFRLPAAFFMLLTIISLTFAQEVLQDSTPQSPRTVRANTTEASASSKESAGPSDDARAQAHCTPKQEPQAAREHLEEQAKEVVSLQKELSELRGFSEPVPIQVSFRVLDVSLTKLRDLGLENDFATILFADPKKLVCSRIVDDSDKLNQMIGSLIRNNIAKVLADVTMMSTNGHPAMYHSGGELPLTRNAADAKGPMDLAKFGTIAEVSPMLLSKDRLKLNFAIRLIDIDRSLSTGEGEHKTPGFRKKEASTTIILGPGQTHLTSSMQFCRVESTKKGKVVEDTLHEFQTIFLVTAEFPATEL